MVVCACKWGSRVKCRASDKKDRPKTGRKRKVRIWQMSPSNLKTTTRSLKEGRAADKHTKMLPSPSLEWWTLQVRHWVSLRMWNTWIVTDLEGEERRVSSLEVCYMVKNRARGLSTVQWQNNYLIGTGPWIWYLGPQSQKLLFIRSYQFHSYFGGVGEWSETGSYCVALAVLGFTL